MMEEKLKTKADAAAPQPTDHCDPRMHLTLADMLALFKNDKKLWYKLPRISS